MGMSARWKINQEQKALLECEFMRKRFPSPRSKKRLADQLNVEPRRIQVWFQNRRQREKVGPEDAPREPSELQSSYERYPGGRETRSFGTPAMLSPLLDGGAYRADAANEASLLRETLQMYTTSLEMSHGHNHGHHIRLSTALQSAGGQGPSILSSSDDIVTALMEFEDNGQPSSNGFSGAGPGGWPHSALQWPEGLHELWPAGMDTSALEELDRMPTPFQMRPGELARPPPAHVSPVAHGIGSTESASALLAAAAKANYANPHVQQILSARQAAAANPLAAAGLGSRNASRETLAGWDGAGDDSRIDRTCSVIHSDWQSSKVPGPVAQGMEPPRGVGQEGGPELPPRAPRNEIDSWIHAADTVNSVLNSARQQYSLATGRHAAADYRRLQPPAMPNWGGGIMSAVQPGGGVPHRDFNAAALEQHERQGDVSSRPPSVQTTVPVAQAVQMRAMMAAPAAKAHAVARAPVRPMGASASSAMQQDWSDHDMVMDAQGMAGAFRDAGLFDEPPPKRERCNSSGSGSAPQLELASALQPEGASEGRGQPIFSRGGADWMAESMDGTR